MRVLVVLAYPPELEGGASIRGAMGLIRGLRESGVHCKVLAAAHNAEALAREYEPDTEVVPVRRITPDLPSRVQARWMELIRPHTLLVRGAFAHRVRALARESDLVHGVESEAAMTMLSLDRPSVAQLDCLTMRDREIRRPWRREDRVSLALLRAEHKVRRGARHLLVNSREVAEAMARRTPRSKISVAPLGLDPSHYTRRATLQQPVAGLIGTARWPPTASAVERLLGTIWPLVLERRPDARLLLAGQGMERRTFPAAPELPGVEWRGQVPSATDFLSELGLLLYPLMVGSGVKVKVLESLALGVPVVTTPEGAEGLGARGGVIVERSDERLAEAAVELMEDPGKRTHHGQLAHETFVRHHSPAVVAKPVIELYERLLS